MDTDAATLGLRRVVVIDFVGDPVVFTRRRIIEVRRAQEGDRLELNLDMTPRLVYASTRVAADSGKACVRRGALVYCAEEPDNGPILPLRIDRTADHAPAPQTITFAKPADVAITGGPTRSLPR